MPELVKVGPRGSLPVETIVPEQPGEALDVGPVVEEPAPTRPSQPSSVQLPLSRFSATVPLPPYPAHPPRPSPVAPQAPVVPTVDAVLMGDPNRFQSASVDDAVRGPNQTDVAVGVGAGRVERAQIILGMLNEVCHAR